MRLFFVMKKKVYQNLVMQTYYLFLLPFSRTEKNNFRYKKRRENVSKQLTILKE